MARKKKKKKQSRDRHSKTLEWPPASDPNPITTSPSTSATTGGGTTASLPPSSALPSAPTTTATEPFLPLSTLPPSLLPTFVRPLAHSILEIHQECFSGTSNQATTTADPGGSSTAPSASATLAHHGRHPVSSHSVNLSLLSDNHDLAGGEGMGPRKVEAARPDGVRARDFVGAGREKGGRREGAEGGVGCLG